ncbi:MAG: hypothetical protein ACM3KM_04000 [Acidobacteriaceae bacterium]
MYERSDSSDREDEMDLGPETNSEQKESSNEELVEEVRKKFKRLADHLDEDIISIVNSILDEIDSHYNPEDDHDKWIAVLNELDGIYGDFKAGNYDLAESKLIDLQEKASQMA